MKFDNLFLVGFARPIIGNVPTISEMQALWITGLISGQFQRSSDIENEHQNDTQWRSKRYAKIDLEYSFPVEMFQYCDRLARLMDLKPTPSVLAAPVKWWRTMVSPATTLHYFRESGLGDRSGCFSWEKRYMPAVLVLFILCLKPLDWFYRLWKRMPIEGRGSKKTRK